ncbi:hypothetical protein AB0G42_21520 [Streptomyces yangpuensis]|uniref:hypothetical protein n=1 Tax=Streptomyces yangpuensis TaxID=1648182 RepID=UPI00342EE4F4
MSASNGEGVGMKFQRETNENGAVQYRAEGASFRYTAWRKGKGWTLIIRRLETVAGIRVAVAGLPHHESTHDTLALCKLVSGEFEALGDNYRAAEHGHRERTTEATLRAYGESVDTVTADAAMIANANNEEGTATMAEKTAETIDHNRIVEEVNANIESARRLAEAENVDGLAELSKETETLISKLPTRGKANDDGQTWTAAKKELRNAFKAAATVQEKPAPKAEVAAKVVAPPAPSYDTYEGVPELVTMGAERAAEGVRLHIKTSTTAKELAAIGLDMWRRMPNKDGNPDIKGDSDQAKAASKALKKAAGEALAADGLDGFDVETALQKLWRAVQTQRTDVRAEYLRGLNDDTEEAAAERERYSKILEDKPEDVTAAEWIARSYNVSLKGQTELARERYHEKKALGSGQGGDAGDSEDGNDSEAETQAIESGTPDEHVLAIADRILKDILRGKPEEFEKASEAAKEVLREKLDAADQALKAMRRAAL